MYQACMMTADEIGLEEGSIIIAHLIPQTESTKSMLPVAKAISDSSAPAVSYLSLNDRLGLHTHTARLL